MGRVFIPRARTHPRAPRSPSGPAPGTLPTPARRDARPGLRGGSRALHLLARGATADEAVSVELGTPGTVVLSGGAMMNAQVVAGGVRADGRVRLPQ